MHDREESTSWTPDRFSIMVPDSWFTLGSRTARSATAISRMVAARVAGHPRLADQGRSVARILREAAAHANRRDAAYCAVMIEETRGPGLSASLTVCLRPARKPAPAAPDGGSGTSGRPVPGPWLFRSRVVDLPAVGPARRTCAVVAQRSRADGARTLRLVMHTVVPVPGRDRVAVISCASPNTAHTEALYGLFDAVTATFRFVRDPRFPGPI